MEGIDLIPWNFRRYPNHHPVYRTKITVADSLLPAVHVDPKRPSSRHPDGVTVYPSQWRDQRYVTAPISFADHVDDPRTRPYSHAPFDPAKLEQMFVHNEFWFIIPERHLLHDSSAQMQSFTEEQIQFYVALQFVMRALNNHRLGTDPPGDGTPAHMFRDPVSEARDLMPKIVWFGELIVKEFRDLLKRYRIEFNKTEDITDDQICQERMFRWRLLQPKNRWGLRLRCCIVDPKYNAGHAFQVRIWNNLFEMGRISPKQLAERVDALCEEVNKDERPFNEQYKPWLSKDELEEKRLLEAIERAQVFGNDAEAAAGGEPGVPRNAEEMEEGPKKTAKETRKELDLKERRTCIARMQGIGVKHRGLDRQTKENAQSVVCNWLKLRKVLGANNRDSANSHNGDPGDIGAGSAAVAAAAATAGAPGRRPSGGADGYAHPVHGGFARAQLQNKYLYVQDVLSMRDLCLNVYAPLLHRNFYGMLQPGERRVIDSDSQYLSFSSSHPLDPSRWFTFDAAVRAVFAQELSNEALDIYYQKAAAKKPNRIPRYPDVTPEQRNHGNYYAVDPERADGKRVVAFPIPMLAYRFPNGLFNPREWYRRHVFYWFNAYDEEMREARAAKQRLESERRTASLQSMLSGGDVELTEEQRDALIMSAMDPTRDREVQATQAATRALCGMDIGYAATTSAAEGAMSADASAPPPPPVEGADMEEHDANGGLLITSETLRVNRARHATDIERIQLEQRRSIHTDIWDDDNVDRATLMLDIDSVCQVVPQYRPRLLYYLHETRFADTYLRHLHAGMRLRNPVTQSHASFPYLRTAGNNSGMVAKNIWFNYSGFQNLPFHSSILAGLLLDARYGLGTTCGHHIWLTVLMTVVPNAYSSLRKIALHIMKVGPPGTGKTQLDTMIHDCKVNHTILNQDHVSKQARMVPVAQNDMIWVYDEACAAMLSDGARAKSHDEIQANSQMKMFLSKDTTNYMRYQKQENGSGLQDRGTVSTRCCVLVNANNQNVNDDTSIYDRFMIYQLMPFSNPYLSQVFVNKRTALGSLDTHFAIPVNNAMKNQDTLVFRLQKVIAVGAAPPPDVTLFVSHLMLGLTKIACYSVTSTASLRTTAKLTEMAKGLAVSLAVRSAFSGPMAKSIKLVSIFEEEMRRMDMEQQRSLQRQQQRQVLANGEVGVEDHIENDQEARQLRDLLDRARILKKDAADMLWMHRLPWNERMIKASVKHLFLTEPSTYYLLSSGFRQLNDDWPAWQALAYMAHSQACLHRSYFDHIFRRDDDPGTEFALGEAWTRTQRPDGTWKIKARFSFTDRSKLLKNPNRHQISSQAQEWDLQGLRMFLHGMNNRFNTFGRGTNMSNEDSANFTRAFADRVPRFVCKHFMVTAPVGGDLTNSEADARLHHIATENREIARARHRPVRDNEVPSAAAPGDPTQSSVHDQDKLGKGRHFMTIIDPNQCVIKGTLKELAKQQARELSNNASVSAINLELMLKQLVNRRSMNVARLNVMRDWAETPSLDFRMNHKGERVVYTEKRPFFEEVMAPYNFYDENDRVYVKAGQRCVLINTMAFLQYNPAYAHDEFLQCMEHDKTPNMEVLIDIPFLGYDGVHHTHHVYPFPGRKLKQQNIQYITQSYLRHTSMVEFSTDDYYDFKAKHPEFGLSETPLDQTPARTWAIRNALAGHQDSYNTTVQSYTDEREKEERENYADVPAHERSQRMASNPLRLIEKDVPSSHVEAEVEQQQPITAEQQRYCNWLRNSLGIEQTPEKPYDQMKSYPGRLDALIEEAVQGNAPQFRHTRLEYRGQRVTYPDDPLSDWKAQEKQLHNDELDPSSAALLRSQADCADALRTWLNHLSDRRLNYQVKMAALRLPPLPTGATQSTTAPVLAKPAATRAPTIPGFRSVSAGASEEGSEASVTRLPPPFLPIPKAAPPAPKRTNPTAASTSNNRPAKRTAPVSLRPPPPPPPPSRQREETEDEEYAAMYSSSME
jgi:hypothetical protein